MTKKTSLSKKIRFEVFKRDEFRCGYCGKEPPSVILEVDHIEPKSSGGGDDICNLITACFDCNRGKAGVPLDKIPLKVNEQLSAAKEKEEQLREYRKFTNKVQRRIKKDIQDISEVYQKQYEDWDFSDSFKSVSLKKFLELLPKHEVVDSLYISIAKFPKDSTRVIQYFCGVCWKKVKGTYG